MKRRIISVSLHVVGLLLLAASVALLFEAVGHNAPGAHSAQATILSGPILGLAGLLGLVAGVDCLRRGVRLLEI